MADEVSIAEAPRVTDRDNGVMVATVEENLRRITRQEAKQAEEAILFRTRLGNAPTKAAIAILEAGVLNCAATARGMRIADATFGKSVAAMKGMSKRKKPAAAVSIVTGTRGVTQVQQRMDTDLFWIKGLKFLVAVLTPLALSVCQHVKDRSVESVASALKGILKFVAGRGFKVVEIRTDGEGAIAALVPDLNAMSICVNVAGPGQHVPVAERMIQTIKGRVRSFDHGLPYVMPPLMMVYCVMYCVRSINFQPSSTSMDKVSPYEQFTGLKLDAKRDLRCGFGDYVQATVPETNNTMAARTHGCICLLPTGNSTGSVKMWCLGTNSVVTRDQFQILPVTTELAKYITRLAEKHGFFRGMDPALEASSEPTAVDDTPPAVNNPLPDMMPFGGPPPTSATGGAAQPVAVGVHDAQPAPVAPVAVAPHAGVNTGGDASGGGAADEPGLGLEVNLPALPRRSARIAGQQERGNAAIPAMFSAADAARADLRRHLVSTADWHDPSFALKITVKRAMRDRPGEALPVILAELQQMLDKGVWHGVHTADLTQGQRRAIIRSSMFLRDKYLASGVFEKFKARLVAGGDQQDRAQYDDLSSPTVATSSVLALAAIAAAEGRTVVVTDIGGAFLNASMSATGVKVHMRLNATIAKLLIQLDPKYEKFVEPSGCIVVELDKALYGCVEASLLWFRDLSATILRMGFVQNPYDQCVFNKRDAEGVQITVAVHVDDLLVTSKSQRLLDEFHEGLNATYPETKSSTGRVVNYIGMCFDFTTEGEVRVTMDNCVRDILRSCESDIKAKPTPAASNLFDIRPDAPKPPRVKRPTSTLMSPRCCTWRRE